MTVTTQRYPLAEATAIAYELVELFGTTVKRIDIGGSIRRGKPDVHDIELVVIPSIDVVNTDLFGNPNVTINTFDVLCTSLRESGLLTNRLDKNGRPAWGVKYKRAAYGGMPLDLFSATAENWGVQFLLRTGPAEFNRRLVTSKAFGGWLPYGYLFSDGALWRLGEQVATPEEADVFAALGLPWQEPEERR